MFCWGVTGEQVVQKRDHHAQRWLIVSWRGSGRTLYIFRPRVREQVLVAVCMCVRQMAFEVELFVAGNWLLGDLIDIEMLHLSLSLSLAISFPQKRPCPALFY